MPGHFERPDGHFRQPFFGASIVFRKNQLLTVLIRNLCRFFSFRCQTVTPAAPMDGTAAQVTMFCWSSAVDRSPGSGTARILFVIPSGKPAARSGCWPTCQGFFIPCHRDHHCRRPVVTSFPAIHLPIPGHFERPGGHFRQPFFLANIIFRKNQLLPVLIWNTCRLF